jgi:hypothetical protein
MGISFLKIPVGAKIKEKVMKKIFLLFVSVIVAGTLIVSCAQPESPSSLTVTSVVPIIEGVQADSIKAEAYPDGILVTWAAGNEAYNYWIWRREVDAGGNPVEGSAGILDGTASFSPVKKIPYYWDSSTKKDARYQYGIVLRGYKNGNLDAQPTSEIVWQSEGSVAGPGVFNSNTDPKEKREIPAALTASVTKINTSVGNDTSASEVDRPELAEITLTGFDFGYTYSFTIEFYNGGSALINASSFGNATSIPLWWDNDDSGYSMAAVEYTRFTRFSLDRTNEAGSSPIANYVDTGSWATTLVIPVNLTSSPPFVGGLYPYRLNDTSSAAIFDNWQARIVAVVGVDTSKYYFYETIQSAASGLNGNEKQLAIFNAAK